MNKTNKVRKGEVRIYEGKTYVAIPEIKEDHCTGCCFYNEGSCLIRDPDHVDFPDCHDSGMIWMQKEINISDIKEKAIKLAIDASSPKLYCDYYIDDRNIGTPLTDKGYVDWNKMLVLLKQKNLL